MKDALHSGRGESTDDNEESEENDPDDASTQSSLERSGAVVEPLLGPADPT